MLAALITLADTTPDDNDVVAGWTAFWIFIALIAAVAFLLWNFTKQLKKTRAAAARGVFGPVDEPEAQAADAATEPAAEASSEAADDEHRATNGG
jgi:cbb3-type cytochrome oxidase subunit 3